MAHIHDGGMAMFDALVYARPHQNTIQFLQQHNQEFFGNLNDAGRQFFDQAQSFYTQMGLAYGSDQLRALSHSVEGMWQVDDIRTLQSIQEIQNAPPSMRRWIMTEPSWRKLYHQQRVDGYTNLYSDFFKDDVGEEHYDYRRVMHGVVVEQDDGEWYVRSHFEELVPGDQDLSMGQRNDILNTWDFMREALAMTKEDVTSPEGNERG